MSLEFEEKKFSDGSKQHNAYLNPILCRIYEDTDGSTVTDFQFGYWKSAQIYHESIDKAIEYANTLSKTMTQRLLDKLS